MFLHRIGPSLFDWRWVERPILRRKVAKLMPHYTSDVYDVYDVYEEPVRLGD
jgi:hypothetical protein